MGHPGHLRCCRRVAWERRPPDFHRVLRTEHLPPKQRLERHPQRPAAGDGSEFPGSRRPIQPLPRRGRARQPVQRTDREPPMGAPPLMRGPTLSSGWRLVVCLVGLVACVEPPSGPGEFGEVRVRPSYAAGEEPATIGVTIDSAAVVVARSSTGERLVDTTTAYTGRALAWVVDLHADPESVSISVELRGDAHRLYAGDTTLMVNSESLAAGDTALLSVAYVGPPRVATVVVTPAAASLTALGATQQFTAEARDQHGAVVPGVAFTWASGKPSVATIDGTGLATAAGHGSTTITATTGLVSGSATLNVDLSSTVATLVVTPATATLSTLGATQQFRAEARDQHGAVVPGVAFTWASGKPSVATIDGTGLATAAGYGLTTITATTGSVSGSATLTVDLASTVATVVVTPSAATLRVLGAMQQFS
ncbi:MAG: Ig domain-containing protein, partial [Chloroflexi bacterium]